MFEICKNDDMNIPIKVWLNKIEDLENSCLEETMKIAKLPFIKKHVALMPDCHASGYNMPIGGVVATKDVIIPDFVSNDIGCGIAFKQTNIPVKLLDIKTGNGTIKQTLVGQIMRNVPVEKGKYTKNPPKEFEKDVIDIINKMYSIDGFIVIDNYLKQDKDFFIDIFFEAKKSFSLGAGNHFIEIQEDEDGFLGIMIHTGSRNIGAKINKYFNDLAKKLNEEWYVSAINSNIHVPFLPIKSEAGQTYFKWMNFALKIAQINRKHIMKAITKEFYNLINKYTDFDLDKLEETYDINVHHNYCAIENVNGQNYYIHRKGAVRARKKDIVPIPGAMGSYSYICQGLQNPDSFHSCSHGAGRTMTRTAALERFSTQEVIESLKEKNVILGMPNKSNVAEEYEKTYKDINEVIENQKDLVKPLKKLKTVVVVKG